MIRARNDRVGFDKAFIAFSCTYGNEQILLVNLLFIIINLSYSFKCVF